MTEQRTERVAEVPSMDTEFKYIVHVRALETFANTMTRQGIPVPDKSAHVSFASRNRLDMRALKDKGLIWSYSVIRVRTSEDMVEEG